MNLLFAVLCMEIYIQTQHRNNVPSGGGEDGSRLLSRSGKPERITFEGEKAWNASYFQLSRSRFPVDLWLRTVSPGSKCNHV